MKRTRKQDRGGIHMKALPEIVTEKHGQPITTSRKVAEVFGKDHKNVLRDIENIISDDEFSRLNFELSNFRTRGKVYPEYFLTKDGFTLLVMGYTGKKARQFKIRYIQKFNEMAEFIKSLQTAKFEFPAFTDAIMQAHDEPKHYHFSNEINMINRIVLGMSASQFKSANGIDKKVPSIRPYLTCEQIQAIEMLQRVDIGLIVAVSEYDNRKQILESYYRHSLLRLSA